jgi:hypothetical protein
VRYATTRSLILHIALGKTRRDVLSANGVSPAGGMGASLVQGYQVVEEA